MCEQDEWIKRAIQVDIVAESVKFNTLLNSVIIKVLPNRFWESGITRCPAKGAPARESRTGTRLVQPQAAKKKKKTPLKQVLRTLNWVH